MDVVPGTTDIPDSVIIEPVSGYAINVPATQQNYPGWWNDEPQAWERVKAMRAELDLTIDDKFEEWAAEVAAWEAALDGK